LENVKLYPSEHQSVVDILLATESEWWDYEKDELWQEHYDAGQTPLIIEYLDKLTSIDQAKTLQYLIKKDQFEALEKYLHLKWVDRIECITNIYPRLIESRYWNIVEKILTEDERKKIWYAILEDNKNNQAMAAYMFTHRHRFCLTLDEIENLSR
jgi:hypothetical protein